MRDGTMGGVAGYWRSGGHDGASSPERAERIEQPERPGRERDFGHADFDSMTDEKLESFGPQLSDERLADYIEAVDKDGKFKGLVEALREKEPEQTELSEKPAPDVPDEAEQPERTPLWQTIAEGTGEVKAYPSYRAMKAELGSEAGTHLHHVVEQSQIDPKRTGFPVERVNSTDNVTRIPIEVHYQVTAHFNRKPLGADRIRRDLMDGKPWDDQFAYGASVLDSIMEKRSADDDQRS